MRKIFASLAAMLMAVNGLFAQHSMLGGHTEKSPEINPDGSVTFR